MAAAARIALTFDVELWSWRGDFGEDIARPLDTLMELTVNRGRPVTLFPSLSTKGLGHDSPDLYAARIGSLMSVAAADPLVEVGIHTHCRDLPLAFPTPHDELTSYAPPQIDDIIGWYAERIGEYCDAAPTAHRAPNYAIPTADMGVYSAALARHGITVDSSDLRVLFSGPATLGAVVQVPPATTSKMGPRHKVWSPDTMSATEMMQFYEQAADRSHVLVMNAHSFLMDSPGGFRPDSALLKTWFAVPPGMQELARPLLSSAKRLVRKHGRSRATSNGRSPAAAALAQSIDLLAEQGCSFHTLTACALEAGQNAV